LGPDLEIAHAGGRVVGRVAWKGRTGGLGRRVRVAARCRAHQEQPDVRLALKHEPFVVLRVHSLVAVAGVLRGV
jgi:hypothetical protein